MVHLFASLLCTKLFATHLEAYAADLSTFDESLPEKAPPPCADHPP